MIILKFSVQYVFEFMSMKTSDPIILNLLYFHRHYTSFYK